MAREDDSEEIVKNIEGNLEEDTKSDVSEEGEIPPKEEENLNKSSGEDDEMCYKSILIFKGNDCQNIILLELLIVCGTRLVINVCESLSHGNFGA